jgi:uncharacterized protein YcnI
MFQKMMISAVATLGLLLSFPGFVQAHAVVYPKEMSANSYEKFTLRVPVEKESDTVKVRIEMPEGFTISRVKPVPGWTYAMEKGADGKTVKAITWSGGKIAPGEFQEFEFQGKTAAQPGKYAFPVYQTYADGETVAWTGPADAKTPASVVEVKATGAAADAHGQEKPAAQVPGTPAAPAEAAKPAAGAAHPLTTGAAYGGLLLGAAALLVAWRRK